MTKQETIRVKILINDVYLSSAHKLFEGAECDAKANYTTTNKFKGYIVKSKKTGIDIYVKANEVEILKTT